MDKEIEKLMDLQKKLLDEAETLKKAFKIDEFMQKVDEFLKLGEKILELKKGDRNGK